MKNRDIHPFFFHGRWLYHSLVLEKCVCAYQDRAVGAFHDNQCRMGTNLLISGDTDRNAAEKLCRKTDRWNSSRKSRKNYTEAEKEARRVRRILANRESARQTIRRKKALYQELTRKAVDLLEENENLKKEKGLAVEEYNSLKCRNKFLKRLIANAKGEKPKKKKKKAEPIITKEAVKSLQAEKPTSATSCSPVFLYNHPLVPFIWPSVKSSNFINLQYLSHSDFTSSTEVTLQHRDMSSSDEGISGPRNPVLVLPLPLPPPFSLYGAPLSYSDTKRRQNETPATHQCSLSDNLFVAKKQ